MSETYIPPTTRVERTRMVSGRSSGHPYLYWHYACVGPDGTRFDNTSIGELRRVLRRKYGVGIQIQEPWH